MVFLYFFVLVWCVDSALWFIMLPKYFIKWCSVTYFLYYKYLVQIFILVNAGKVT